jgi:hypothetical protein
MNSEVLNSWKEIAAYLGRGVRTVQRWEQELGLPVRRPRGRERSAVIALKPDLDLWLHKVPRGSLNNHTSDPLRHEKLHLNAKQLHKRTHEVLERSTRIYEIVRNTMALTIELKSRQAERLRKRAQQSEEQHLLVTQNFGLASNGVRKQSNAAERREVNPSTKTSAPREPATSNHCHSE